jgi:hypothetical protein
MTNVPARDPEPVGVKVMFTAQLLPAAKLEPQVLVWAKSPVTAMELIVRSALPVLVKLTTSAELALRSGASGNVMLAAERVAVGLAVLDALLLVFCIAPPQPAHMPQANRINNKAYGFRIDILSCMAVLERTPCLGCCL